MKFNVIVKQNDEGDLYIELPDELIEAIDWKIEDTLIWSEIENGSWAIRKSE